MFSSFQESLNRDPAHLYLYDNFKIQFIYNVNNISRFLWRRMMESIEPDTLGQSIYQGFDDALFEVYQ